MRSAVAVVAAWLVLATPAVAAPPSLSVGGTLLEADGAVVSARSLSVDPVAEPGVTLTLAVDGRRVSGAPPWRIVTRDYGDGPHEVVVTATNAAGETATETARVRFTRAQRLPRDTARALRRGGGVATAVANAGDVDGDGREDVLVGGDGGARLVLAARTVRFTGPPGTGRTVAAGGDLNGDGYRDLLIGSDRRTYAVFGGPALRSLDLRLLGRRGLTIRAAGALATRRLGDFAVDGDVNGDGLDDIAIGVTPGRDDVGGRGVGGAGGGDARRGADGGDDAGGRGGARDGSPSPAGGAERTLVVLGRRVGGLARAAYALPEYGRAVTFPGDIDHDGRAELLAAGPAGAYVAYGRGGGYALTGQVTSVGSVGDVDGDSTPDLLFGGPDATYVVFTQPGQTVDLDGAFAGFRINPPPGAGPPTVAGAGDLDGDYAPDVAIGFAGAAFVVFSPLDVPMIDLANLPGELGARVGDSPAVDGLDAYGAGVPAAIVGGPGGFSVATGFAGAEGTGCLPNALWSFPLTTEQPLPRCRRSNQVVDSPAFNPSPDANQLARFNPDPACGLPSRTCQPTSYRSGNARISGPDVGLMTDDVVELTDSYGTRIAAIRRLDPTCFAVFDRTLTPVGTTCDPTGDPPLPHPIEIQVQGRACMATAALEDTHYLIRLLDPSGPPAAAYRELQGFVRRDQLSLGSEQTTIGGATYSPEQLAEAAYSGCGPTPPKRAPVPAPAFPISNLPTGDRLFLFTDRYVSNASFAACEGEPPPDLRPGCYGPLANYQVPTLAFKDPQLPTGDPRAGADWAALTVSTTGASGAGYPGHPQDGQPLEAAGGGLVRAIVPRAAPFTVVDGFAYSDPNVPCDTLRLARWLYGGTQPGPGERAIYGWTPFRDPQGLRERNGLSPGCP